MPKRYHKFMEVRQDGLVEGGLVRYDGIGLSSPSKNVPVLDDDGNLSIQGHLFQSNNVATVKNTHAYKMHASDTLVLADSKLGALTITLPPISEAQSNVEYSIKDSGGVASQCPITVQTASRQEMIQTGHSLKITHDYGMVKLLSDGSQWLIMSEITQLRQWRVRFV